MRLYLIVLAGTCSFWLSAQSLDPPEIAALPIWPRSGAISPDVATHHIFRDVDNPGSLVVSYPSKDNPEERTTFTVVLSNRVEPTISVKVSAPSSDSYSYLYALRNGARAQTPIRAWSLVVPADDPRLEMAHPEWRATKAPERNAVQAFIQNAGANSYLSWSDWNKGIGRGAEETGFRLTSAFRPGATTAYVTGDGVLQVPEDIPQYIDDELAQFEKRSVIERAVTTIGPRFSPDLPSSAVAVLFRSDVQSLVKAGLLDVRSAFVQELTRALASCSETGKFPKVKAAAASKLETDLMAALGIDFRDDAAR